MSAMQPSRDLPSKALTELGEEKLCSACGEYWPADTEFFEARKLQKDGLSSRCIACSRAKIWGLFRQRRWHTAECAREQ